MGPSSLARGGQRWSYLGGDWVVGPGSQGTGAVRRGLVLLTDPVRWIGAFQEGAEEESRQVDFSDQEGVR